VFDARVVGVGLLVGDSVGVKLPVAVGFPVGVEVGVAVGVPDKVGTGILKVIASQDALVTVKVPVLEQSLVPSILHETFPVWGKVTVPRSALCPGLSAGTSNVATILLFIYNLACCAGSPLFELLATLALPLASKLNVYLPQSHANELSGEFNATDCSLS
jgi:hypothetical protein